MIEFDETQYRGKTIDELSEEEYAEWNELVKRTKKNHRLYYQKTL